MSGPFEDFANTFVEIDRESLVAAMRKAADQFVVMPPAWTTPGMEVSHLTVNDDVQPDIIITSTAESTMNP